MVLIQNKIMGVRGSLGSQQAITLLELIVAMALSSLVATMAVAFFKDAGNAARLSSRNQEAGFQSQAFFSSLCENILGGGGVLVLTENRLALLNAIDLKMEYTWVDSVLSINGNPQKMRIAEFKVEPFGPDRPESEGSYRKLNEAWELDSLDDDRDGRIDFDELDRNRDEILDATECRFVGRYRVTLTTMDRAIPTTLVTFIHPRNHLKAMGFKKWDFSEVDAENLRF